MFANKLNSCHRFLVLIHFPKAWQIPRNIRTNFSVKMSENLSSKKEQGNAKYARKEYWDERYEDEVEYDWLGDYLTVKSLILEYIPNQSDRILMLGCGNSSLSKQVRLQFILWFWSWENQTLGPFSPREI